MDGAHRFGRYTVTGTLGSGAMGCVYAAVDDVLGRAVAVKTLRGGATGLGARMLDERFRLEARAIAALNHPGIVQVYDIDLAAEPPYLVMERMAGPSLREHFEAGPLPIHELRALGIQIARALAAAHTAGIVHRDVKPANILVAGPGAWKLADFGVAHVPDSSLTMTGQFIGSPAYAPPEALLRGQSTPAGDVFGLGATLYYGAAGRWPRADATSGALLAPLPSVRELAPHLPEDLIAIVDRAVAIEPDRRPTAAELADALARASSHVAPPPPPSVQTQFVPDATADGARLRVPANAKANATAFVADETRAPDATAATVFLADTTPTTRPPVAARSRSRARRYVWLGGGGALALALALVVLLASRGGGAKATATDAGANAGSAVPLAPAALGSTPAAIAPGVPEEPELELPPPGQIRAVTPPIHDRRAAEQWNEIVEALYEHKFGEARDKVDAWERRWGASKEIRHLRQQLERLPAEHLADE